MIAKRNAMRVVVAVVVDSILVSIAWILLVLTVAVTGQSNNDIEAVKTWPWALSWPLSNSAASDTSRTTSPLLLRGDALSDTEGLPGIFSVVFAVPAVSLSFKQESNSVTLSNLCQRFTTVSGPYEAQQYGYAAKPCVSNNSFDSFAPRQGVLCSGYSNLTTGGVVSLLGRSCWQPGLTSRLDGRLIYGVSLNNGLVVAPWKMFVAPREGGEVVSSTSRNSSGGSDIGGVSSSPVEEQSIGSQTVDSLHRGIERYLGLSFLMSPSPLIRWLPLLSVPSAGISGFSSTQDVVGWTSAVAKLCGAALNLDYLSSGALLSSSITVALSPYHRCMGVTPALLDAVLEWVEGLRCRYESPSTGNAATKKNRQRQAWLNYSSVTAGGGGTASWVADRAIVCERIEGATSSADIGMPFLWLDGAGSSSGPTSSSSSSTTADESLFSVPLQNVPPLDGEVSTTTTGSATTNSSTTAKPQMCVKLLDPSKTQFHLILSAWQIRSIPLVADPVLGRLGVVVDNATAAQASQAEASLGGGQFGWSGCKARRVCRKNADTGEDQDVFVPRWNRCLDPVCTSLLFKTYDIEKGECRYTIPLVAAILLVFALLSAAELWLIYRRQRDVARRIVRKKLA